MNKLFVLSIILIGIPVCLASQITINTGDMPVNGDTIRRSTALDVSGINYMVSGPNYSWDFSNLGVVMQQVDTFVSVQQTPWVYQLIFFLAANQAKPLTEFDQVPGFEVTDVFEYYKNSSADYRYVGFGLTLNGIPIPNKYTNADIIYKFPVQYGNIDSSTAQYTLSLPGLGYAGGWKKRVNHADGWGVLKTPFGEFQTLRIKSSVTQYDSVYIDTLGMGLPILREYVEYKWLGNGFGLPLCEVTDDGLIQTCRYIDSVRTLLLVYVEDLEAPALKIYPNPAKESVSIDLPPDLVLPVELKMVSAEGILMFYEKYSAQSQLAQSIRIDLSSHVFKPGMYILQLHTGLSSLNRKLLIRP